MINFQNQPLPVTLMVLEGSTEMRCDHCKPYATEQGKIILDYVYFNSMWLPVQQAQVCRSDHN